jgi:hypothetical protein
VRRQQLNGFHARIEKALERILGEKFHGAWWRVKRAL